MVAKKIKAMNATKSAFLNRGSSAHWGGGAQRAARGLRDAGKNYSFTLPGKIKQN